MPTYRNDSDSQSYRINDTDDIVQTVKPGETIETYDTDVPDDFTETVATPSISETMSGEGAWTDGIKPKGGLNISISGSFSATITLQRSWDDFANSYDVDQYSGETETYIEGDEDPNVKYRIGINTGDHSSGDVVVSLSRRKV